MLRQSPRLTPASLAARRANALKSTGPRTDRGKAWSSLNALRHGRRAQDLLAKIARMRGGAEDSAATAVRSTAVARQERRNGGVETSPRQHYPERNPPAAITSLDRNQSAITFEDLGLGPFRAPFGPGFPGDRNQSSQTLIPKELSIKNRPPTEHIANPRMAVFGGVRGRLSLRIGQF